MPGFPRIAYHPDFLTYDFGPTHPLRPQRISAGLALLQETAIWDPSTETLRPDEATPAEVGLVHAPEYVQAVEMGGKGELSRSDLTRFGFSPGGDNPPFPGMHHASALVAGGSTNAMRAIMRGSILHVFNPAGGLHHAVRDRASGFCIYNDPAVAAAIALEEFGARVLYVDFDCHHGDGVQWLFYDEPRVMTLSFHESGKYLFPGTGGVAETGEGDGTGYSLNVPFQPFTEDDSWLEAVRCIFPATVKRFKPDVIVSAHGADTHSWDPLTHLSLTTRSFVEQARLVHEMAHEFAEGRWLAVGSGGYDWQRVVPRSWAILWSEMAEKQLPERLPQGWADRWSTGSQKPFPLSMLDLQNMGGQHSRREEVNGVNANTVRQAQHALGAVLPQ